MNCISSTNFHQRAVWVLALLCISVNGKNCTGPTNPSVHCLGTHFDAHCCEWNLSRTPNPAFLSTGTAYNFYLNLVPTQTWHATFALNKNTDPSTFCSCSVGFLDPGFLAQGFLFLLLFFPSFFLLFPSYMGFISHLLTYRWDAKAVSADQLHALLITYSVFNIF